MPTYAIFCAFASLSGMLAVLAGALAAHDLAPSADIRRVELFKTAVDYQFYNSLCLLVVGLMSKLISSPTKFLSLSGWSLCLGISLFCGSLYFSSLSSIKPPYILAPAGGFFLIIGWGYLFLGSFFLFRKDE